MSVQIFICFTLALFTIAVHVHGASILTDKQQAAIVELREQLKNELSAAFMTEDYWLGNWLRNHNFNLEETKRSIRKHLQMRNEQNMEDILSEDWTEMGANFPYIRKTFDKSGKPLLYIDAAEFDVSAYLSSSNSKTTSSDRLTRYFQMMHEESEAHVRQLREEGRDISQYNYILNFGGFTEAKHVCIECIQWYRDLTNLISPYVMVNVEKTVVLNVPYVTQMLYSVLNDKVQTYLQLYGQDQEQWEKALLDYIDRDQFPQGILDELDQKENTEGLLPLHNEV